MRRNQIIYITVALAILLIAVLIFLFTKNNENKITSNKKAADKNLLVGDWVRTDGSYLIKINKVNEDGILEAQYYNPNPINVESAKWEEVYDNLKLTIVLRDVNYPGSTYTLNYLSDRDFLAGEYFQAVERSTFYVEFSRNK